MTERGRSPTLGSDHLTAFVLGSLSLLTLWGLWEFIGRQDGSALASVAPPPSVFLVGV